ncbi:hypothetical protein J8L73_18725 [Pseudoalteromonas sp. MMG006]|uniref:hypothetical protein n=1 Tax=Pseudoalteromonas sp. MMG006 TaxID=2822683 RepID=UPI001B37C176|nr:hypothetical protein [Pseudoalteromonas sp. MMG006]MBQ4801128.1 hypothetical protein [Pseudoalteromonas sp. MMG006]
MNTIKRNLFFITALISISACSSNDVHDRIEQLQVAHQKQVEKKTEKMDQLINSIPDWYLDVPQSDSTGVFGVGYGSSNKPPFALKAAELRAKFDVAKSFKQLISGQERSYENQTLDSNLETQINMLIDSIVEEVSVAGAQRVKRELYNVDGVANAYVLVKMPYEEYNRAIQSLRAKTVEEKMSVAFDELEKRLQNRKSDEQKAIQATHQRDVELKELEIKKEVELRKAEQPQNKK